MRASSSSSELRGVTSSFADAGWLLTADDYFNYDWPPMPPEHTGSGGSVRRALDGITAELSANPSYRFVWSETIWLAKWWPLQTPETQAAFRALVARGAIEIVGGGWVQVSARGGGEEGACAAATRLVGAV